MKLISDKIRHLPLKPGVYLFKNDSGEVIYVGKAQILRDRVSSYMQLDELPPKVRAMTEHIADLDYIITESAHEALILENNLIKQYQPHYNIKLRDDKEYSYIVITKEPFPRINKSRSLDPTSAHYFGPFTNSFSVTNNIKTIRQFFPIRSCRLDLPNEKSKPCLDYHIGLCSAPCFDAIYELEYNTIVSDVLLLLSGRYKKLEETLKKRMTEASTKMRFEEAARFRESIKHLQNIVSKQRVVSQQLVDRDVFSVASDCDRACVEYMKIRSGRLILDMQMFAGSEDMSTPSEFLGAMMRQIYATGENMDLPEDILVSTKPDGEKDLINYLNDGRMLKKPIKIVQPKRGDKIELISLGLTNAKHHLAEHLRREILTLGKNAVIELQEALNLKRLPILIEGYDIANIQGTSAVGSQVSFKDGKPNKKGYRIYKIKTKETPDDYQMLREVLSRRRERWDDEEFATKPDLMLIDGGVGQLGVALEVMKGFDVELASLAKEEELVIREGQEPIRLKHGSAALRLLQQVRDESHRFAGKHFRALHQKKSGLTKTKDKA